MNKQIYISNLQYIQKHLRNTFIHLFDVLKFNEYFNEYLLFNSHELFIY